MVTIVSMIWPISASAVDGDPSGVAASAVAGHPPILSSRNYIVMTET
jgi:hypothetical protein